MLDPRVLRDRLARSGTVRLADGLEVTVLAIHLLGHDQWQVSYAVPPVPDGVAVLAPPYSDDLDEATRGRGFAYHPGSDQGREGD